MTDTAMTPDRLAELHNRDMGAVTPGPWLVADGSDGRPVVYVETLRDGRRGARVLLAADGATEADVQFIASARCSVPELLAEVDRLRGRIAELEGAELPDEHPMDRATRLGVTRIPEDIVNEVCEATNTGRPTGWHVWAARDGEIWEVTDATYDGDTVLMPCAGDMEPMLRRDVEKHFGPLTPKGTL